MWDSHVRRPRRELQDVTDKEDWERCKGGAGLYSCEDAPPAAQIRGSDSRLVFLHHNQFAVWVLLSTDQNPVLIT